MHGHVSHSSGLAKTILQGTVKGGRRQGRQRKRWEDNIRAWTGLEFSKSQRAVENREKWRKLDVKSSVVPQRPLCLRDRWWWRHLTSSTSYCLHYSLLGCNFHVMKNSGPVVFHLWIKFCKFHGFHVSQLSWMCTCIGYEQMRQAIVIWNRT